MLPFVSLSVAEKKEKKSRKSTYVEHSMLPDSFFCTALGGISRVLYEICLNKLTCLFVFPGHSRDTPTDYASLIGMIKFN